MSLFLATASIALLVAAGIIGFREHRLRQRIGRLGRQPEPKVPTVRGGRLAAPLIRLHHRLARPRRKAAIAAALPDALALMGRCLRAGAPVGDAIAEVGRQGPPAIAPLFRAADQQLRLGQSPELALSEVVKPLAIAALSYLVVAISVQRETGGNLAATLDALEGTLRRRAQLAARARALSAEARASAAIIGSLPVGMALLLGLIAPEYMAPMVQTTAGRLLAAIALASLVAGGWIMLRLARLTP
jgi:tight adherence protein B